MNKNINALPKTTKTITVIIHTDSEYELELEICENADVLSAIHKELASGNDGYLISGPDFNDDYYVR